MTDKEKLMGKISESGIKLGFLCEQLGICRFTFSRKLANLSEFTASEIVKLTELLHLTPEERDAIFFAKRCE